ncbi:hypothetical protein ES703_111265 [subsurface metagenome]
MADQEYVEQELNLDIDLKGMESNPDWKKTQKGRIVYARAKKPVGARAVTRFLHAWLEEIIFDRGAWAKNRKYLVYMVHLIGVAMTYRDEMEPWEGFKEGEFGGAGATRPF